MSNFFETETKREFKYKILVWPNITFQQNLEQDSYVVVLHNIIKNLNAIRDDLFWTIVSPSHIRALEFENTEQLVYPFPSFPNTMRIHFDVFRVMKILDVRNKDYDLVYCHLPEQATALKNLLYNQFDIRPPFIGYAHFFEFPETVKFEMNNLLTAFGGICDMNFCGINTQAQKNLVLKHAEGLLSKPMLDTLDEVLQPQYLGNEDPSYNDHSATLDTKHKVIVFNHRPVPYKDYPWFLQQMDLLWEQRQDFRVWVPLADASDIPYLITGHNATRLEYMSNLSKCSFGVAGIQKYAGWSVSVTDGFSVGVPYLLSDEEYYHELAGDAGIYFGTDFLEQANKMLDKPESNKKVKKRYDELKWPNAIKSFNKVISGELGNLGTIKQSESIKKILSFIKNKGYVTKKGIKEHMGWGGGIRWDMYRNMLRNEACIKLTATGYEYRS